MNQKFIFLLSSVCSNPLKYWNKEQSLTGNIRTVLDQHLLQNVVELREKNNVNYDKTSIMCPIDANQMLNIKLPYLVFIIKNVEMYCFFRLQLIDKNKNRYYLYFYNDKCHKRRIIKVPNSRIVEVNLEREWNKLELDLPKLVWMAFQTTYEAVQRIQICGNCRLRRIYFIDGHYTNFDISPKLCQNFFENYMTKWGTCIFERSIQTEKYKCSSPNNSESIPIVYLNMIDSNKEVQKIKPVHNKLIKVDTHFWKMLRSGCRNTIDNFFNINTKSTCCLKNPKLKSISTSGVERQKILLSAIKFINNIQDTNFSLRKDHVLAKERKSKVEKYTNKLLKH